MQIPAGFLRVQKSASDISRTLNKWFPTPEMLAPRAAGIDLSEYSIKWLTLEPNHGNHVGAWGSERLPAGIIDKESVRDVEGLTSALSGIRASLGDVAFAHAALPEEAAYVFEMHVPLIATRAEIMHVIEFESEDRIPIPLDDAVYDFDVVEERADGKRIAVTAFPVGLAESYVRAFAGAGIGLLSLELEARSIARSVVRAEDGPTLLVDFGRERTGLAVVENGIPIFTSTVDVGGDLITRSLVLKLAQTPEEAESFRNEQGLNVHGEASAKALTVMSAVSDALAEEVTKHYRWWDTRRDERGKRAESLSRVVLVGGSSNLRGLDDFLAARVQAPVERGNVWRNIFSLEEYIPPIERSASLQYATAAGLALRSLPIMNV